MSFKCYVHNWSSAGYQCPMCFPFANGGKGTPVNDKDGYKTPTTLEVFNKALELAAKQAPSQPAELVFTADDFQGIERNETKANAVATLCNAILQAWLKAQPSVNAYVVGDYFHASQWSEKDPAAVSTHTAKLVCIRPIKTETAEDLLREIVSAYDKSNNVMGVVGPIERARKLVGGK